MKIVAKPEELRAGDQLVATGRVVESVKKFSGGGAACKVQYKDGTFSVWGTGVEVNAERPVVPGAVAVDTYGGYVFSNDEHGVPFTAGAALKFAAERNEGLKVPTYQVFLLTPVEA
jgi:hypothetical protein